MGYIGDVRDNHVQYATKGARRHVLPGRHVLNAITKGDPSQRAIGNYAKATPGVAQTGPNIFGKDPAGD